MFYRVFLKSIFVLVCCAVLQANQVAVAAQRDAPAFLQTMRKIVKEKGGRLLILLGHHKKYCWDGTDPNASDVADYREIVAAIGLLELDAKLKAAAVPIFFPLDNYIEYRLALADAALKSNCLNIADEQYRAVLKEFTHPSYNRYRDLAKIGVDDVREKRVVQTAADQKNSGPSRVPWELVGEWLPQSNDLIPKDIGKCKPTSSSDSGPFSLRPDGLWSRSRLDETRSQCVLSIVRETNDNKAWAVTSTCEPNVTKFWMQSGSARHRIITHDLVDKTATGGAKKTLSGDMLQYRRCE
jgi:hypothetical protein